ncbi:NAD-dependent protein deacetylase [Hydrocarboniphaga sp.]|uniref:NAD-dependent protein deacetylase n=1 Tax=Hydrocarboniphaga sp. TaxID=2033016 RepID=UPI003D102E9C
MDAHPTPSRGGDDSSARLAEFIARHRRLFVLGGAGCSTDSGIPDYRDEAGTWKRRPPVTWQAFTQEPLTRARYWARSLVGWPLLAAARPNAAHASLAQMERAGQVDLLVTQNVDGLHQAAGSERVIDLHGRIDRIVCTACGDVTPRAAFQLQLAGLNPDWAALSASSAPDGDADLEAQDFSGFVVPQCPVCGGRLKPDVVFFGENVPPARVAEAMAGVERADAMLIVGSSLMVFSGYRFAHAAAARGIPIAAINRGATRADPLLALKIERGVGEVLSEVSALL